MIFETTKKELQIQGCCNIKSVYNNGLKLAQLYVLMKLYLPFFQTWEMNYVTQLRRVLSCKKAYWLLFLEKSIKHHCSVSFQEMSEYV